MALKKNSQKQQGSIIKWDRKGKPVVPDDPVITYIEGDGTGPDIWKATKPVIDEAVRIAYDGRKKIIWLESFAGEKALNVSAETNPLPEQTIRNIKKYGIAIKGPLSTPIGKGMRSLNVTLRQTLDLYSCVRPVRYFPGVPSPVTHPEKLNIVIFRENTEDVYAGIEWEACSDKTENIIRYLNTQMSGTGKSISEKSAVGIKPMSEFNSRRLVRMAIQYAMDNELQSVTLVHKGNIMKYTEGAFRDWGYKTASEEFPENTLTEDELYSVYDGKIPAGKVLIKDRIADAMFQQLLLRPDEYQVIATSNLNGDYISDAAAAQVGGLGMAPGANIGDKCALFEATHGTAPKYAGLDKVNPGSLILSGVEMLNFMGWSAAAEIIVLALTKTILCGEVTYDLARQMMNAKEVKCSEFGTAICRNMN